ncbi:MAG: cytochrome b561 [Paraglaciecola sp.]|jgi:cytochrome b561
MIKNSQAGYGWLAITIHWISALVVIAMFAAGWWMVELDYYSTWYKTAPLYHKSTGILLCILTLARLAWRFSQISPRKLGRNWEKKAAKATHIALYLIIFSLFCSGYLISTADDRGIDVFNWFTLPSLGKLFEHQEDLAGILHEWLAYSLIGLAILHALAALKHHFFDKDQTLSRMLRPITKYKE